MKHAFLRLAVLICAIAGLSAQAPKQSGQGAGGCENAVTTAAMRTCEESRYTTANRELDKAYQGLMDHLDTGQKQKLRIAQQAWLRFRDANADFESSRVEGGTLAPLLRLGTLTEMTIARTAELKKDTLP
jgi:uncharacterized protein YecT (DUF1311 family)